VAASLALAGVLLAGWWVYPVLRLHYHQERELQTLQAELAGLQDRNEDLREQVEQLKTPEGVEQLARESLGLVKPGEQAYVVTGGTSGETTVGATGEGSGEPLWRRFLDAVFGFR
jgi:cell division protein FtsL